MSQSSRDELTEQRAVGLTDSQIVPFIDFALRTRSPLARDVIRRRALVGSAHRVTHLERDMPDLDRVNLNLLWGSAWARMTALWDTDEDRLERAAAIFDAILDQHPARSLPQDAAACYAQTLLRLGRDQTLQTLLLTLDLKDMDRWCLRTDLLNPWRRDPGSSEVGPEHVSAWSVVFNEVLDQELSRVKLLDDVSSSSWGAVADNARVEVTPYQRLAAPTKSPTKTSRSPRDLVTVVMSAYKPGPDLHTAVRSVLAQTWSDFELLIVDDCSGPNHTDLLRDVAAQDARIKIITAEVNAGTYAARNLALQHARGRYVTFQDSDDWTHPQRIEAQVQPLIDNVNVLASRSRTLRAYPDLTMTYVGYSPERLNASSLLFEREPVIAAIGGFDETRKSADMEFPLRLKAMLPGSVRDLSHPAPLAITQLRSDSLSRSDAVPGWTRWDRIHYRDAYLEWHERLKHGRSHPNRRLAGRRAFPLPNPDWSLKRAPDSSRSFDVVVLGDFRNNHPRSSLSNSVVELAHDAGLHVGLATRELPEPLSTRRPAFSRQTQRMMSEQRATLTHVDLPDVTRALLITEPEVLLHLAGPPSLRTEKVWVYVSGEDLSRCSLIESEVKRHFGRSPLWIPKSRVARDQLIDRWGVTQVHSEAVPIGVVADLLRVPGPDRVHRDLIVIGHHLPDRAAYWPSGQAVLQAYPTTCETVHQPDKAHPIRDVAQIDVRMLAGVATGTRALRLDVPPPGWCSLAGTGMSTREFLNHLDVFVYQGPWNVAAHVAALEAISAGRPTVLPLAAWDDLGHASCYAAAPEVEHTLARIRDEPGLRQDMIRRGTQFLTALSAPWASLFGTLPRGTHLEPTKKS